MKNILKTVILIGSSLLAGNALHAKPATLHNSSGQSISYTILHDDQFVSNGRVDDTATESIDIKNGQTVVIITSFTHSFATKSIHMFTVSNLQAQPVLTINRGLSAQLTDGTITTLLQESAPEA